MRTDTSTTTNGLGELVRDMMRVYGMTAPQLAERLKMTRQNVQVKLKKGTFNKDQLEIVGAQLHFDPRKARELLAQGYNPEEVRDILLADADSKTRQPAKKGFEIELSADEVKQIMINQARSINHLEDMVNDLRVMLLAMQDELIKKRGK